MNPAFAMLNGWEIVGILVIVLILFGAKRLPELARGLGKGIKEFKKSSREVTDELQSAIHDDDYSPPPAASRKIPENTAARSEQGTAERAGSPDSNA